MEYLNDLLKHWDTVASEAPVIAFFILALIFGGIAIEFLDKRKSKVPPIVEVPLTRAEKKELCQLRKKDPIYLALKQDLDREVAAEAIREGFKCMIFDGKISNRRANFWMAEIQQITGLPVNQPVTKRVLSKISQSKADYLKAQIKKRLNGGRVPAQIS